MAEKLQNILELVQMLTVGLAKDNSSWKHYLECAGRFLFFHPLWSFTIYYRDFT